MIHVADAVGELLRTRSTVITPLPIGRPDVTYTVRAPSLLDQLADAVASSSNGRGGRTVPGSRLPLDSGAVDLWWHMQTTIHGMAKALDLRRRGAPGAVLRRLAAAVVKPGQEAMAATLRRRCWCGKSSIAPDDCGRCWVHKIEAMMTPQFADRELRGVGCWECRTETLDPRNGTRYWAPTTTVLIEQSGERVRVPAIVVRVAVMPGLEAATADDLWIYRMCRACGAEGWLDYTTSSAA